MPIYLPPISRRRFLATTLVAGAGLCLKPALLAADNKVNPHCWALFSDTHIAADPAKTSRDTNMTEHFITARQDLLAQPERPAGFILSGDCAFNSGEESDYAAVSGLLQPVRAAKIPVYLTLGNHDDRGHFWNALAEMKAAPRPVADHQVALIETERANWFILDSCEQVLSTPGLLGTAQLQWLANTLDAHADKPALVVVHHNLTPPNGKPALKDTAELLAVIRPRKQVKAYIFGHTHDWNIQPDASGIQLINLPPVGYVFDVKRPAGWTLAFLEREGVRLEMRRVDVSGAKPEIVQLKWRA